MKYALAGIVLFGLTKPPDADILMVAGSVILLV